MYSMNYIGKFIANFRDFYNEINGATLTGAIDVVVVEQPDGSFTCSPFHVRFGKLGVLRSRFKVVDLELNGETLPIQMKLGESGEAFFVEEVGEDEAACSAHLATSPIPAGRFEQLYEPRRRNSLSAVEPDHGQASDYTKRRYTADGQTMQKPDFSKLTKKDSTKETEEKTEPLDGEHEALFEMDGLDGADWPAPLVKTFSAAQLEQQSSAAHVVQMISETNDFRPIEVAGDDPKLNGNGKKKKKRKVSSKKKHQRKSSSSSASSQSERAGSEQRAVAHDHSFYSDSEINNAALNEEMSNLKLSGDKRIPLALSDTAFEVHAASRHASSRGGTPVQSDTEAELSRAVAAAGGADKSSQSWRWGELPSPPPRADVSAASTAPPPPHSAADALSSDDEPRRGVLGGVLRFMGARDPATVEGVYLDDLHRGQVDPDLYFPKHHTDRYRPVPLDGPMPRAAPTEEEYESGNGPSLPQSPASLDPQPLDSDEDDKLFKGPLGAVEVFVREPQSGVSRALPFDEWCARAAELSAGSALEVRVRGRLLPWRSAAPLLLSLLSYQRPLPARVLNELEKGKDGADDGRGSKARYSWWSWGRSNEHKRIDTSPPKEETAKEIESVTEDALDAATEVIDVETVAEDGEQKGEEAMANIDEVIEPPETVELTLQPPYQHDDRPDQGDLHEQSSSDSDQDGQVQRHHRRHSTFRKTLRLSSDQIKKLNLRSGMNEMVFSVTTAYQGTTRCKCNVFRWRHDDKVVISDIDGTITKSDVLGHIFPLVGKDWAQSGVAQLFTKIKNNGYQLLYLSARAIGQARVTREYLRSIRQGEVCLPDGPLLLNPTSLLRAFHREVIEKKPEEFKIQCLADIKALFPAGSSPFYAGYGNRVNDVCAYQAVGIPIVRIFTINYKGELKHELTQTFQSTYSHMSVLVDQVFPPALCDPSDEFSQTVYWREPLAPLDLA